MSQYKIYMFLKYSLWNAKSIFIRQIFNSSENKIWTK